MGNKEYKIVMKPQFVTVAKTNKKGVVKYKNMWRVKVIDDSSQVLEEHDFEYNKKADAVSFYFNLREKNK